MANNSTFTISVPTQACDYTWYYNVGAALEQPVYYVVVPICLSIGFIGRLACLIAFYKQSKKESAYFYQVSLTVGELLVIMADVPYNLVMTCGWNLAGNPTWCLSKYWYLWYEAHLAVPLVNMTHMIKQLQAIFMAADRVVAVWKPAVYKSFQHRSLRVGSVIVAVLMGVSTSIFDCFRYKDPVLRRSGGTYSVNVNFAFLDTTTAKGLSQLRDALRCGQLVVLVGLNIAMIYMYLKQTKQIHAMLGQTEDARKQRRKVKVDHSLLLLTLSQCIFGSISSCAVVIYYFVLAARPSFDQCEASLWGPVLDAVVRVCDVFEFASVLVMSKYFRRILFGQLPCSKSTVSASVHFA